MTKYELRQLRELRRLLTLESAGFANRQVEPERHLGYDKSQTIKEVTRLWRETWVLPIIDGLLNKYDK